MSVLSTHVLDTARGRPAAGVTVELWRMDPVPVRLVATVTDADGRAAQDLLPDATFVPGRHELRFGIGAYFAAAGLASNPPFHDVVTVSVFLASGVGHYHVPLLASPFAYTTYRGS